MLSNRMSAAEEEEVLEELAALQADQVKAQVSRFPLPQSAMKLTRVFPASKRSGSWSTPDSGSRASGGGGGTGSGARRQTGDRRIVLSRLLVLLYF